MDVDIQHSYDVFANFICDCKQLKRKQLKFWRIFNKVEVFFDLLNKCILITWYVGQLYVSRYILSILIVVYV
jgi:hypothetical protein